MIFFFYIEPLTDLKISFVGISDKIQIFTKNYVCLFMVFNATFNNISAISWQSVLLVEETIVPGEIDCCETFKVERILIFPVFGSNNWLVRRTTALHQFGRSRLI
jgi:hypothetical protein